jgi:hypothetical protein
MNKVVSQFSVLPQEAPLAHGGVVPRQLTGATPVPLEDFIHELRQPLGVIDSLAYYLELTATDEKHCVHLQRIRAMVGQANRILERASLTESELVLR